ncbi:ABC transporter permease [Nocardioides sp.]|uniref:ABC transporter permease n=1 Tax=Nocardioides sp. TaxID=35761 RepID=UPI0039E2E169
MLKLVVRRTIGAIPLLLIVSFLVFLLLDLMPGDAAVALAGENASPDQVEATRERLGLDEPLFTRYFHWLGSAVHGDLGQSLFSSQSVTSTIVDRLPVTMSLTVVAMVLVVVVGMPLGIVAARRPNSVVDRLLSAFASVSMSLPPFVTGLLLMLVFAVTLAWFPATGYVSIADGGLGGWLRNLVLPALAVAAVPIAEIARQTRGALVDTLGTDYVRTVRAKGVRERSVLLKHALKNAGVPIATVLGLQVNRLLAGSVTVEFVFAMPGFGALAVTSVVQRDIPTILGVVMVSAVIVVVVNVLTDLSYGLFNPRLRH